MTPCNLEFLLVAPNGFRPNPNEDFLKFAYADLPDPPSTIAVQDRVGAGGQLYIDAGLCSGATQVFDVFVNKETVLMNLKCGIGGPLIYSASVPTPTMMNQINATSVNLSGIVDVTGTLGAGADIEPGICSGWYQDDDDFSEGPTFTESLYTTSGADAAFGAGGFGYTSPSLDNSASISRATHAPVPPILFPNQTPVKLSLRTDIGTGGAINAGFLASWTASAFTSITGQVSNTNPTGNVTVGGQEVVDNFTPGDTLGVFNDAANNIARYYHKGAEVFSQPWVPSSVTPPWCGLTGSSHTGSLLSTGTGVEMFVTSLAGQLTVVPA